MTETTAEFLENGMEAKLDEEIGNSKYAYKNKGTENSCNDYSSKTSRISFSDEEGAGPQNYNIKFIGK